MYDERFDFQKKNRKEEETEPTDLTNYQCQLKSPQKSTETSKRMLTKFVSIGSYSPEVHTFGTLIMSTKVFSLIISKTL